jgi:hypothetical protein
MPKRSFHLIATRAIPTLAAPAAALAAFVFVLAAPAGAQSSAAPSAEPAPAPPAASPDGGGGGGKLYRWVDKDKTVHYSDRPQPGADALDVKPAQTYSAPAPAAATNAARSTGREANGAARPRASCGITSPTQDQVFPNVQSVMVSYRGPNDGTAQLQLGGTSSQSLSAPAGQSFTISPIARGTYTATVTITGEAGSELCRTQTVTFHVRQPSLLSPVRQQMNRRAN